MKNFFRSMRTFLRALPHFLLFELLFKLILAAIGAPVLALLLKLTMKAAGVNYLNGESLFVYLHSPVTILALLVMLFIMAYFSFIELTALAACFSCYGRGEKITVGGMLLTGLKAFRKAFRKTGILRFLLFMLMMPMAQFTLSSGMFMSPLMPMLRRVFLNVDSRLAVLAYVAIQLIFILAIISRSYSLHYLILTPRSFPDCAKISREKIKKKKLRMAFFYLLWSLFILLATALLTFGISFIIVLAIKGFTLPGKAFRSALRVLRYAGRVFAAISAFFSAPAIMCWLTGCFDADVDEDEKITIPDRERKKMKKGPKAALILSLAAAGLLLNGSYIRALYRGNISLNVGILSRTQVSAHRGFSWAAPENTELAFSAAVETGTDYIELDVQQTADGRLVVCHDATIDRTTDGTGRVSDYTYEELQQFTASAGFSGEEYSSARIMLLSDVFEKFGGDVLFNVEIKDVGSVAETTEKTVAMIKEYGLESSCYVTSFSYTALRTVKETDPKIKTALITHIAALSSYSQLSYIDAVSMNYIFVNQSVVNTVHSGGKKLFVWTVDDPDDIKQMIALGVDNIITNRPDRAAEIIDSGSLGDFFLTILEYVFSA